MPLYGDAKRAYACEYRRKRRQAWLDENSPCVDCGGFDRLEVDHVDATTKNFNPTNIWTRRKEIRDLELAKCVVRCHDCHKAKTTLNKEQARGEDANSKLTTAEIIEIREKYSSGNYSYRQLGKEYGVVFSVIGCIVRREIWKHIE